MSVILWNAIGKLAYSTVKTGEEFAGYSGNEHSGSR